VQFNLRRQPGERGFKLLKVFPFADLMESIVFSLRLLIMFSIGFIEAYMLGNQYKSPGENI
jgi:hypothetical protein